MRLQCGRAGLFWAKNSVASRVSVGRTPPRKESFPLPKLSLSGDPFVSVKIHSMIPGRWRGSRVGGRGCGACEVFLVHVPMGWTQR